MEALPAVPWQVHCRHCCGNGGKKVRCVCAGVRAEEEKRAGRNSNPVATAMSEPTMRVDAKPALLLFQHSNHLQEDDQAPALTTQPAGNQGRAGGIAVAISAGQRLRPLLAGPPGGGRKPAAPPLIPWFGRTPPAGGISPLPCGTNSNEKHIQPAHRPPAPKKAHRHWLFLGGRRQAAGYQGRSGALLVAVAMARRCREGNRRGPFRMDHINLAGRPGEVAASLLFHNSNRLRAGTRANQVAGQPRPDRGSVRGRRQEGALLFRHSNGIASERADPAGGPRRSCLPQPPQPEVIAVAASAAPQRLPDLTTHLGGTSAHPWALGASCARFDAPAPAPALTTCGPRGDACPALTT